MSLLTRAVQTVSTALRRKGTSGNLYAPGGGGWTGVFTLGNVANRSTGQIRMSEGEQLTHNVGVVFTAVNRIAEDVSSLQVSVEISKRGGRWVPDPTHPLQLLLNQPVPWAEGTELRHVLIQHLCLLGRAALLAVDGTHGEPRELHLLYPHLLDPIPDPVDFISVYRYRSLSGQQQYFPRFSARPSPTGLGVLECKVPSPTNPYAGSSAVQAGANSITLDAEIRAYARFYFSNNAMPGAVLESDKDFPGVAVAQAQKESWNEQYQGVYNAGKLATLWGGLKLRSMAPAFKDLAFPEITKATRQDILMHFGVPGPVIGYTDTGALGADTFSAAKNVYQSQTLDPHRKRLQRFFNLLASRWPGCRVVIESPVEEDVAALEKRQLLEYQGGVLSREEYRTARSYELDGQPNLWVLPRTSQIYHGLSPDDMPALQPLPDPNAPPADPPVEEEPKTKASRYRAMWASEYRELKAASPAQRASLPTRFAERWTAEGEEAAALAASMRQAALQSSGGDLALAYEALKAEAKAFAEVTSG